jgi:diacylglycerol kinase family enzyme
VFVKRLPRIKLIQLFALLLIKLHIYSKKIQYFKTNEVYLEPIDHAVEIWGDGQYLSSLPAKLSLAAARLRVLSV